jgi:monoamine oxidase
MRLPMAGNSDDTLISRRRLLGSGAAAGAGTLASFVTPARARTRATPLKREDVVVVGAGLAGLAAARSVAAAGRSVVLLEANGRVGGRTLNHPLGDGQVVEVGGQFAGPTQDHVLALAKELGVATFTAYGTGPTAYVADGQTLRYNADTPLGDVPPDPRLVPDAGQLFARLDQMAASTSPAMPWTAADAATLDAETVGSWVRANAVVDKQRAYEGFELFHNSFYGNRPDDVGLLYLVGQIAGMGNERTTGTIERGLASKGGAQESRFVGGSQLISIRAAQQLGRRLILNSPVRRIEQHGARVKVVSDRRSFSAKRVIVAIPPPMVTEIIWNPLLPVRHDAVRRRMALGTLAKIHAVYDEPFWRKDTGTWRAVKIGGAVKEMFDNTPPSGKPGILMGFMGGHGWRTWMPRSLEERKQAVLRDFADAFGQRALRPIDYFEQDWTQEPWIRGGPVSVLGPGTTTDFLPVLAQPFGLVHWAGTETSDYWNGYMDGAVRSGERAAKGVLGEL